MLGNFAPTSVVHSSCMSLARSELEVTTLHRLPLIAGYTIPVFIRPSKALARKFYFEQRYWVSAFRFNPRDFTRYERENNVVQDVRGTYSLLESDITRPTRETGGPLPIIMSSRGLLCWLLTRAVMSGYGRGVAHQDSWNSALTSFGSCCQQGAAVIQEAGSEQPQIQVGGATVFVQASGKLDLREFIDHRWSAMADEWSAVRDNCAGHKLPAFSDRPALIDFLRFTDLRLRASPAFEASHWLPRLRAMLLRTASFLLEVLIESELHATAGQVTARPAELYGERGARRSPHQHALRMSILEQIYCYGSREVIARSLGRGKGTAAQLASCFIRLYADSVRKTFSAATSVAVHWDGSTHDGHDVQVGCAILPARGADKNVVAILAPVARFSQSLTFGTDFGDLKFR